MGCISLMGSIFKAHITQYKTLRRMFLVKHKSNTTYHSIKNYEETAIRCYLKNIITFESLPEKAKEKVLKKKIDLKGRLN